MNKEHNIMLIIGLILIVILLFRYGTTFAIVPTSAYNSETTSLVEEKDKSVIFKTVFSASNTFNTCQGDLDNFHVFTSNTNPNNINYPGKPNIPTRDDLNENIQYKASSVDLKNIIVRASCGSDSERDIGKELRNVSATCAIVRYSGAMTLKCARIYAEVIPIENGNVVNANVWGFYNGEITVEIPKKDIECTLDIHCNSNEECNNNVCEEVTTTQIYYRYISSSNNCSVVNILPSAKTSNDYNTLTECENNIVITNQTTGNQTSGNQTSDGGATTRRSTTSGTTTEEPKEESSNRSLLIIGTILVIVAFLMIRRKK